MNELSQAKLISCNMSNVEICSSAARISTTHGNSIEIFHKAKDNKKNLDLIQKVLKSGHSTIIEHAVFTFALCNVSAYVEQFFIEYRLASFTVKSRRYVDFSNLGYYVPPELTDADSSQYHQYMQLLFSAYQTLLENDIPKEDARFLLPYSFHSNFYCTINARELKNIISSMKYGRGQGIPELQSLAGQMICQVNAVFPGLLSDYENTPTDTCLHPAYPIQVSDTLQVLNSNEIGNIKILNAPSDSLQLLKTACQMNDPSSQSLESDELLKSKRPRELEQLSYTFLISDLTLSGITHIVRHRMQSIMIPPIQSLNHSRHIIPDTVRQSGKLSDYYLHILEAANQMVSELADNKILNQYHYYYALSGNTMDIITSMNARELNHFFQLRTCRRAQWEIRKISIDMLRQLRSLCPELFQYFGPRCYVNGVCPEGNLTCSQMEYTIEEFKHLS